MCARQAFYQLSCDSRPGAVFLGYGLLFLRFSGLLRVPCAGAWWLLEGAPGACLSV